MLSSCRFKNATHAPSWGGESRARFGTPDLSHDYVERELEERDENSKWDGINNVTGVSFCRCKTRISSI